MKGELMLGQYEAERNHLLAMIEAAQRGGRTEREITAIIDRYFGEGASRRLGVDRERNGLVRRLIDRAALKRAA
jgi:hypothetical protein